MRATGANALVSNRVSARMSVLLVIGYSLLGATMRPDSITELPTVTDDSGDFKSQQHVQTSFSNGSVVSELQHTICSVRTEDVVAKAQSTASRTLTGVCTSEQLSKSFASLERTMLERLELLSRHLTDLIDSKFTPVAPKKNDRSGVKSSPFRTVEKIKGGERRKL